MVGLKVVVVLVMVTWSDHYHKMVLATIPQPTVRKPNRQEDECKISILSKNRQEDACKISILSIIKTMKAISFGQNSFH